jgi:hypothetical protein
MGTSRCFASCPGSAGRWPGSSSGRSTKIPSLSRGPEKPPVYAVTGRPEAARQFESLPLHHPESAMETVTQSPLTLPDFMIAKRKLRNFDLIAPPLSL